MLSMQHTTLYSTCISKHIHVHSCTDIHILCFTGESGLVYCGYLDSGGGRDMVAIKTCKGMEQMLIVLKCGSYIGYIHLSPFTFK